jgi:hypothetical protein
MSYPLIFDWKRPALAVHMAYNDLRFDVAVGVNVEARFNAPGHQSEFTQAVLDNIPDHLEYKAHDQVKSAIRWVDIYGLYNKKICMLDTHQQFAGLDW